MNDTTIIRADFGNCDDARVELWTLTRGTALGQVTLAMTNFGATIQQLVLPDSRGQATDIALGYDDLADYIACDTYFGATVGRYANRIRGGELLLDGMAHQLDVNEPPHHLHGGRRGFDKRVWDAQPTPEGDGLTFRLTSPDGDMGYPGTITLEATYRLTQAGELRLAVTATTDAATLCNVVQHSLWNLGGHASGSVLDHELRCAADCYIPVGPELIPTGEVRTVADTPFDFRRPKAIGRDLHLLDAAGYDHNFVLGAAGPDGLRDCATLLCPANGLGMWLRTDQPGVQIYAGTYLTPERPGKGGMLYRPHAGIALETQVFPDSPHHAHFPQAVLRPGRTYRHHMTWDFFHTRP